MQSGRTLYQDAEVIDRAIIYDTATGEVVSSHTFAASGPPTDSAARNSNHL
jgi:hypothetical protein